MAFDPTRLLDTATLFLNKTSLTPLEEAQILSTLQHSFGVLCGICASDPYELTPDEYDFFSADDNQRTLDGILVREIFLPLYRAVSEERIGTSGESFNTLVVKYSQEIKLSWLAEKTLQRFTPIAVG